MGSDRSRGNDIVHYLHKELKMKRRLVREKMKMNPFWCCVPLTTITSTLQLLREAGVQSSQICDALTILLYPKEDVCKLLHLVDSQPEVDCCRIHGTREMQPDLLLPLLLYYLERPFHFSGNGVWDTQAGSVIDNAPDHTSLIEQV